MTHCANPPRRRLLAAAGATLGALLALSAPAARAADEAVPTRPIPQGGGERLPIVGIGTAVIFDYENDSARQAERAEVLQALVAGGGRLVDTAPAYGRAEDRLGELMVALGLRERLFLATKVDSRFDPAAMQASLQASQRRLKTGRFDLMQAWNVAEESYDFGLLREWKAQGLTRYVGMTTSFPKHYDAIARVLAREKPDFFQVNYSLGDRQAERVLLPMARDAGAAVLVNLPFGRNSLFRKAGSRPLPEFAAEFGARSWAQFFLKFILSHPAVTAVIPGTDKPAYMRDNLQAGRGAMPDAGMRRRMTEFWDALT